MVNNLNEEELEKISEMLRQSEQPGVTIGPDGEEILEFPEANPVDEEIKGVDDGVSKISKQTYLSSLQS